MFMLTKIGRVLCKDRDPLSDKFCSHTSSCQHLQKPTLFLSTFGGTKSSGVTEARQQITVCDFQSVVSISHVIDLNIKEESVTLDALSNNRKLPFKRTEYSQPPGLPTLTRDRFLED